MEFNCSICLENIEEYDCTKTNCGHLFHPKCFWKWCKSSNQCPNCRADLMEKDRKAELNLTHLLDSRTEIINQVEEAYEELDSIKLDLEYTNNLNIKRQSELGKLDAEINIANGYLRSLNTEIKEIEEYKLNPLKVLKKIKKRKKKKEKKEIKKIYNKQRQQKKKQLAQLRNIIKISDNLVENIVLNLYKKKIDWDLPSSWELLKFIIMKMIKNSKSDKFIITNDEEYEIYNEKKKKKNYEFRFTNHEMKMFKEDTSDYKQVKCTPCNCNICSNNSMDKCSDLNKFCKNHNKFYCNQCSWCFEHEYYCKMEKVEDNDCIFDQEQLYYGMPELEDELEYSNLFLDY